MWLIKNNIPILIFSLVTDVILTIMSINLHSRIKVFKKVKNCSDSKHASMLSFVGGSGIV